MSSQNPLFLWLFGKIVPILDFFLFEVLLTKRGAIAVFAAVLGYFGTRLSEPLLEDLGMPPKLGGWSLEFWVFSTVATGLLVLFSFRKWTSYVRGPYDAIHHVAFSGFFEPSGPEGNFVRTGVSKDLEKEFLRMAGKVLSEHKINSGLQIERGDERVELPLKIEDYRPPRGLYAVHDVESFEGLARSFSSRCIGVVWGTVSKDSRIERFEITVDPARYHGRDAVEPLFKRVGQVAEHQELPPQIVIRYMARVLAATWAYSYCQMLNDLNRHWESLAVAADSRRVVEGALAELGDSGGSEAATVVQVQRRTLLPLVLRQEAWSLLLDGLRRRALERLLEALKIDLFSPLKDAQAFADYYNHSYAFEVEKHRKSFIEWVAEQHEDLPEWLGDVEEIALDHVGRRAMVDLPVPNLPLFVNWIELAFFQGLNITELIDDWFSKLTEAHPDEPFVLVHWGDALKVQAGPQNMWSEKSRLAKVDKAIRKYEAAYALDSSLSVLAARLWTLYVLMSVYIRSTSDGKRRRNKAKYWAERAQPYYEEYLPSRSTLGTTDEENDAFARLIDD